STSRRRTSRTTRTAAALNLLVDSDLFISLCNHPGHALRVLDSLGETLALALIKRPGSGEVWRSSVRSQSKHKRACQAKSKKQLSHSRSPSVVWIITEMFVSLPNQSTKNCKGM